MLLRSPLTTDQQIAQILLEQKQQERTQSSAHIKYQIVAALGISLLFLILIWHRSGFSWAASNVLLSDFYVLTLAIGNPWRWYLQHNNPEFRVSAISRTASWFLLLLSLSLGLTLTPGTLNGLQGRQASDLQQAQQLQQELGN